MVFVSELVQNRDNFSATADQSVIDVVRFMVDRNIGAIGVVNAAGELAGLFSERDLMKRVVAQGRDPQRTLVSEVMTGDPLVVDPKHTLEQCMELLKTHGFRHLPVCQGRKLLGLISMRDLMEHAVVEKDGEVQMMRAYISTTS